MNVEETIEFADLIRGKYIVNGNILTVLYDSSGTHSFISHNCVGSLDCLFLKCPKYCLFLLPLENLLELAFVV